MIEKIWDLGQDVFYLLWSLGPSPLSPGCLLTFRAEIWGWSNWWSDLPWFAQDDRFLALKLTLAPAGCRLLNICHALPPASGPAAHPDSAVGSPLAAVMCTIADPSLLNSASPLDKEQGQPEKAKPHGPLAARPHLFAKFILTWLRFRLLLKLIHLKAYVSRGEIKKHHTLFILSLLLHLSSISQHRTSPSFSSIPAIPFPFLLF